MTLKRRVGEIPLSFTPRAEGRSSCRQCRSRCNCTRWRYPLGKRGTLAVTDLSKSLLWRRLGAIVWLSTVSSAVGACLNREGTLMMISGAATVATRHTCKGAFCCNSVWLVVWVFCCFDLWLLLFYISLSRPSFFPTQSRLVTISLSPPLPRLSRRKVSCYRVGYPV